MHKMQGLDAFDCVHGALNTFATKAAKRRSGQLQTGLGRTAYRNLDLLIEAGTLLINEEASHYI